MRASAGLHALWIGALASPILVRTLLRLSVSPWRDFNGRVALVTGGTRGLGLILSRKLAEGGARLAICGRNQETLESARAELESAGAEVLAVQCDIGKREDVEKLVREVEGRFGRIDLLINNAGIIQVGPYDSMSLDDFDASIDANFRGAIQTTWAALPLIKRRKTGRIINITSIGGVVPVPHLLPYTAAKFGFVGFSDALGAELARENIGVLTVIPGMMRTGSFLQAFFKGSAKKEFTWFSLGSTLPGVSMSADRAANRILKASLCGERRLVLGLPAKFLERLHSVFPRLVLLGTTWVNRLLPEMRSAALGPTDSALRGAELRRSGVPPAARPPWTVLGDLAAQKNREVG